MKVWVGTAATKEEALNEALKKLKLPRERVTVEVLEEIKSSLFSMMGYHRVRVKVTEKVPGQRGRDRDRSERGERNGRDRTRGEGRGSGNRKREDRNERGGRGRNHRRGGPQAPTHQHHPNPEEEVELTAAPMDTEAPEEKTHWSEADEGLHKEEYIQKEVPLDEDEETLGEQESVDAAPEETEAQEKTPAPRSVAPAKTPAPKTPAPEKPEEPAAPPVDPETVLAQWKELLQWQDLEWAADKSDEGKIKISLKTSWGEKLSDGGGKQLESLQHLFNLVLKRQSKRASHVSFVLEGQRPPEEQKIIQVAQQAAEEVARTGRLYRLDPMESSLRQIVHDSLKDHPQVETASEGEGPWRKVVVRPRAGDKPAPSGPAAPTPDNAAN